MSTLRTLSLATILAVSAACSNTDASRSEIDAPQLTAVRNTSLLSVGSITITPATATLAVGSTLTLSGSIKSVTGVDLTATLGSQVTLTSSDTTIARVSSLGVVTGIRAGVAKIVAKLGTVSGTSTITVVAPSTTSATTPGSITITPASATIAVGATLALTGDIKSTTGTDVTATFASQVVVTSSDSTIATISRTGIVTGIRAGVATITAKLGTLSSTSAITVGTAVTSSTTTTTTSLTPLVQTTTTQSGGSPVSSMALVSDDYRHYSSTQDLLANISSNIGGTGTPGAVLYNDGFNPQLLALDNTITYNGHSTVKYNQPGGNALTPQLWVNFPGGKTLTNMWLRVKLRYSPGYTTYGVTPNCANAYKLLGWGWAGTDGRGSLEFTNTNQYVFEWYVTNTAQTELGEATVMGAHTNTEWTDGQWYDYIIHYTQTSSTTISMTWWLAPDGQTPVQQQTATGSMTTGVVPAVNRVLLGLNFNSQRPASESQALWYGQWEVIDGSQYANPYGL